MNISVHFSGINVQESNCWLVHGKCMFSFFQKIQNCFPERLCCVHPHWKCVSDPVSLHPCWRSGVVTIFYFRHLKGAQ